MSKIFVVDIARCSGCYNCQLACKDEHAENDWLPYAAAQPLTGQFWCRVEDHVHGTIPKVKIHYESQLCRHCENEACMNACPAGAIYRREAEGFVLIDPAKCTGCRACITACPYGMVYFNEQKHIAQKCTGCAHLLDAGYTQPRCVEACPTDALRIVDAEPVNGERVVYKNRPGRFIGGLVYDPVEKEVIIGAECTLSDGRVTLTDDFGDFWFHNLPEGRYDLTIQAEGYAAKVFQALSTEGQDVNLGDIAMDKLSV